MIRIVKKCLGKTKVEEKKWDYHFAFMHFDDFKNCYINGKPLKWWHVFRNGDIIEIIERPSEPTSTISYIIWTIGAAILNGLGVSSASVGLIYTVGGLAVVGAAGAIGTGIYALAGGFGGGGSFGNSGASGGKEYSSTSTPELKGANNDVGTGIIPVVVGRVLQTPSYAQFPYIGVNNGTGSNKLYQYFISNYNNVDYSDFKLGDTAISDYSIDYISINQGKGVSNFIGFDNVKKIDIKLYEYKGAKIAVVVAVLVVLA